MKVYIVFEDKGQYEDAISYIIGVFNSEEKAEELRNTKKNVLDIFKGSSEPEFNAENEDQYNKWQEWHDMNDINYYKIEEHEVR